MATLKGSRNNTLAGTLVIVSIFATIAVVIMLAGGLDFIGKRSYTVSFDFQTGVEGLEAGSQVHLGGRTVGTVAAVSFHRSDPSTIEAIHVTISVDNDIQFKEGAIAFLQKPLLGSTSVINFVALGEGPDIAEDDPIPGRLAPPSFLAQAGFGEDQQNKVQSIIERADEIAKNVQESSEWINTSLRPQADAIAGDVRAITADAREKWPDWASRVDEVFDNIKDVSGDARGFLDNVDERTTQLKDVLATAQAYLDDNREDVRASIANAKDVSEKADAFMDRLNGELADLAADLLESGKAAADSAETALAEAENVLLEQRPNIRETMANFRLTSDQVKDTLLEIRAAPWRLLYRPNVRDLEYELLYNSARSYARTVGEVRILTDRLETILAKPAGDITDEDRAAIAEFITDLARTRESYEKVESAFLDHLIDQNASE
ncbi:unnamed protein product [Symbiodinium necroappetens]|uniref:Mce/MlaD domain-containing protein n=1 Tax=Symbiodinium necroappetens TaxID=1628268 RepID=A0A813C2A1_9DINO|nr:unnamed protein product [Symbiodinium necroappetens]